MRFYLNYIEITIKKLSTFIFFPENSKNAVVNKIILSCLNNFRYRLYYNQGTSDGEHRLTLVNWWIAGFGLYQHPTLPPALSVYKDFKKRLINVPVIHVIVDVLFVFCG